MQENTKKNLSINKRFSQFSKNQGLSNYRISKDTGISEVVLSNYAKQKSKMSVDAVQIILNNYEVNPEWLLTGKGSMLRDTAEATVKDTFNMATDRTIEQQKIPLYNIEATAGLVPLFDDTSQIEVKEFISIPRMPKCDGAIFVTGDSMYPLLKSGDIIVYQKIHDKQNSIFWGEMYIVSVEVDGEEYVTLKYVQKSDEGKEYIKLVSENRHHQPKDVHLDKIRALAIIKASIRINSM